MKTRIPIAEFNNLEVVKITWINNIKIKAVSVGFLIDQNEKEITIAGDFSSKPDDEMFVWGGSILTIPKESVSSIDYAINL